MAVTVGKYHLFERERRGRSYFYYWYEVQGRRILVFQGYLLSNKMMISYTSSKFRACSFLEYFIHDLTSDNNYYHHNG